VTEQELIKAALAEDLAGGVDITSQATISADANAAADFVARMDGVIAGIKYRHAVLAEVGITDVTLCKKDGDHVKAGDILITVRGNTRAILLAERTALNFFGHLSGIATLTNKWVAEVPEQNVRCVIPEKQHQECGLLKNTQFVWVAEQITV
jgi:nicotinate-nucleotide pyrophosphorylase (carboxylating)